MAGWRAKMASWRASMSDFLKKIWPLVLVLIVTIVGWFLLAEVALEARVQDAAGMDPSTEDYDKAKAWATELLGLAGTFAGFFGITRAAQSSLDLGPEERARIVEGGMIGVLAGATLLGVGGWPVPIALAAMAIGAATARVVRTIRE